MTAVGNVQQQQQQQPGAIRTSSTMVSSLAQTVSFVSSQTRARSKQRGMAASKSSAISCTIASSRIAQIGANLSSTAGQRSIIAMMCSGFRWSSSAPLWLLTSALQYR